MQNTQQMHYDNVLYHWYNIVVCSPFFWTLVKGEVYCHSLQPRKGDCCELCIATDDCHNAQEPTTSESSMNAQLRTEVNHLCDVFERIHHVAMPFCKLRRKVH